ncbi:MAG: hypothetical protein L7F77_11830 [Candidatus Magnetominusculus sp. LBB02]|nr:hypothetical protein [Candidatus Magnetominusculus sp. LBB02]
MFPKFTTTGIGSLPHEDARKACRAVIDNFDIPFWPQLPKRAFTESMIVQYSEGMPFIRIDDSRERVWVERQEDSAALTKFYEAYAGDIPASAVSEAYAAGFYEMVRMLQPDSGKKLPFIKGHITGPLTFTLGLKDGGGRDIFYDEELREIAVMLLISKAAWQVQRLRELADSVVIFIDEPVLSSVGSSTYLGISEDEIKRLLKEAVDGVKRTGAIVGLHSCGKCDWPIIFDLKPDIVNFDAYGYFDTIAIYQEAMSAYVKDGGTMAWGIVPTTDAIKDEGLDGIKQKFMERYERLHKFDSALVSNLMLTPSCGTGSLNVAESEKVFALLKGLKDYLISEAL